MLFSSYPLIAYLISYLFFTSLMILYCGFDIFDAKKATPQQKTWVLCSSTFIYRVWRNYKPKEDTFGNVTVLIKGLLALVTFEKTHLPLHLPCVNLILRSVKNTWVWMKHTSTGDFLMAAEWFSGIPSSPFLWNCGCR